MIIPSIPHLVLLFFLGGVFIHFLYAGSRTLYTENAEKEPAAGFVPVTFMLGGTLPVWFLGLYQRISLPNGVFAACILVASIALYEWARATIWGRRFGMGWGNHVPDELCEAGPYRFIRHPIYLAYMLGYFACFVALPHWITALMVVVNVVLFTHAARTDEWKIAASPLATEYADYRKRVGLFWPKFNGP